MSNQECCNANICTSFTDRFYYLNSTGLCYVNGLNPVDSIITPTGNGTYLCCIDDSYCNSLTYGITRLDLNGKTILLDGIAHNILSNTGDNIIIPTIYYPYTTQMITSGTALLSGTRLVLDDATISGNPWNNQYFSPKHIYNLITLQSTTSTGISSCRVSAYSQSNKYMTLYDTLESGYIPRKSWHLDITKGGWGTYLSGTLTVDNSTTGWATNSLTGQYVGFYNGITRKITGNTTSSFEIDYPYVLSDGRYKWTLSAETSGIGYVQGTGFYSLTSHNWITNHLSGKILTIDNNEYTIVNNSTSSFNVSTQIPSNYYWNINIPTSGSGYYVGSGNFILSNVQDGWINNDNLTGVLISVDDITGIIYDTDYYNKYIKITPPSHTSYTYELLDVDVLCNYTINGNFNIITGTVSGDHWSQLSGVGDVSYIPKVFNNQKNYQLGLTLPEAATGEYRLYFGANTGYYSRVQANYPEYDIGIYNNGSLISNQLHYTIPLYINYGLNITCNGSGGTFNSYIFTPSVTPCGWKTDNLKYFLLTINDASSSAYFHHIISNTDNTLTVLSNDDDGSTGSCYCVLHSGSVPTVSGWGFSSNPFGSHGSITTIDAHGNCSLGNSTYYTVNGYWISGELEGVQVDITGTTAGVTGTYYIESNTNTFFTCKDSSGNYPVISKPTGYILYFNTSISECSGGVTSLKATLGTSTNHAYDFVDDNHPIPCSVYATVTGFDYSNNTCGFGGSGRFDNFNIECSGAVCGLTNWGVLPCSLYTDVRGAYSGLTSEGLSDVYLSSSATYTGTNNCNAPTISPVFLTKNDYCTTQGSGTFIYPNIYISGATSGFTTNSLSGCKIYIEGTDDETYDPIYYIATGIANTTSGITVSSNLYHTDNNYSYVPFYSSATPPRFGWRLDTKISDTKGNGFWTNNMFTGFNPFYWVDHQFSGRDIKVGKATYTIADNTTGSFTVTGMPLFPWYIPYLTSGIGNIGGESYRNRFNLSTYDNSWSTNWLSGNTIRIGPTKWYNIITNTGNVVTLDTYITGDIYDVYGNLKYFTFIIDRVSSGLGQISGNKLIPRETPLNWISGNNYYNKYMIVSGVSFKMSSNTLTDITITGGFSGANGIDTAWSLSNLSTSGWATQSGNNIDILTTPTNWRTNELSGTNFKWLHDRIPEESYGDGTHTINSNTSSGFISLNPPTQDVTWTLIPNPQYIISGKGFYKNYGIVKPDVFSFDKESIPFTGNVTSLYVDLPQYTGNPTFKLTTPNNTCINCSTGITKSYLCGHCAENDSDSGNNIPMYLKGIIDGLYTKCNEPARINGQELCYKRITSDDDAIYPYINCCTWYLLGPTGYMSRNNRLSLANTNYSWMCSTSIPYRIQLTKNSGHYILTSDGDSILDVLYNVDLGTGIPVCSTLSSVVLHAPRNIYYESGNCNVKNSGDRSATLTLSASNTIGNNMEDTWSMFGAPGCKLYDIDSFTVSGGGHTCICTKATGVDGYWTYDSGPTSGTGRLIATVTASVGGDCANEYISVDLSYYGKSVTDCYDEAMAVQSLYGEGYGCIQTRPINKFFPAGNTSCSPSCTGWPSWTYGYNAKSGIECVSYVDSGSNTQLRVMEN